MEQRKVIWNLLIGRILTNIGDSLIYMSVLWYFNSRYQSPLFLTLVFIITSGVDALSFLIGPILDRWQTQSVLLTATISQVIISSALVIGLALHLSPTILAIFLLIFLLLSTISSALIYPTEDKLLPLLTKKDDLLRVNGLFQMSYQVLDLVLNGLILGMIAYLSINTTLVLAVPVFGIAFIVFRSLNFRTPTLSTTKENSHYFHSLKIGWSTLIQHPFMLKALFTFSISNFFYGAADTALPRLAREYLSSKALGYGALLTGIGIGSFLGTLLVQQLSLTGAKLIKFSGVCMLLGSLGRLLLLLRYPWIIILFISLNAFWISMMNINFMAFVQSEFSPTVLGRISTINESLISLMIPFGSAIGGLLIAHFNVLIPQILYALVTIAGGIYFVTCLLKSIKS